jgi:hypothetical protein
MARGGVVSGETREEAERSLLAENPGVRVIDARTIDLSDADVPAHMLDTTWWAVAVAGGDPSLADEDDPLGEAERKFRHQMKSIAENPVSQVTGVMEQFDCPACGKKITLNLPPPQQVREAAEREGRVNEVARCPECGSTLWRTIGKVEMWRTNP